MPKLTEEENQSLLSDIKSGDYKVTDLVSKYNISKATFYKIKKQDVPEEESVTRNDYDDELNESEESEDDEEDLQSKLDLTTQACDMMEKLKLPPKNENPIKITTKEIVVEEEDPNKKRLLLQQIKNYIETFRPHLVDIIGNTPTREHAYMNQLKTFNYERLTLELDEIKFCVSNKNSFNMMKNGFFYGTSLLESIGTNYLELELTGLTKELSRNAELQMCLAELGCIYGVSSWSDPRFKLIALTGMTVLSIDSRNRLEIALAQESQAPQAPPPSPRESGTDVLPVDIRTQPNIREIGESVNSKDDELLKKLKDFHTN
jgi:hypothetical protein